MKPWQNVEERRRIRAKVESLQKRANEIADPAEKELHKALARVQGRELARAQSASADLASAAHLCRDADLRERIEEVRRDVDLLVF